MTTNHNHIFLAIVPKRKQYSGYNNRTHYTKSDIYASKISLNVLVDAAFRSFDPLTWQQTMCIPKNAVTI